MTESQGPDNSAGIQQLIVDIGNSDIRWDGSLIGLLPTVVGDSARQLLTLGTAAIPPLISALNDDSKFVVAHVLLTLISGVEYQLTPWNRLEVDLLSNGQAKVDATNRFELARRWTEWQQITPHPPSLPD